jgi:hypothetical protein
MTCIIHGFRFSVVSYVRERVRDFWITFALYAKKSSVADTKTGRSKTRKWENTEVSPKWVLERSYLEKYST